MTPFWKEFLTYSKKERAGIIALLMIMLLSVASYFLIDLLPAGRNHDYSEFKREIDEFESQRELVISSKNKTRQFSQNRNESSDKSRLFPFDPNSLSLDSLKLLGISDKIGERIIKYRNAGGKFREAGDLRKIYGFPERKYTELLPYISLKGTDKQLQKKEESGNDSPVKKTEIININLADTTQLKSLKGIGSKLSQRIYKFRNSAGGFYSIDQLSDVYGIKPEVFEQIRPFITIDDSFKRIKINEISAEELKNHPYIYKWNIANAIVNYRDKHGNYKQATDLLKTDLVTEEICRKIAPYLIFE